jgi:hypothetical protein
MLRWVAVFGVALSRAIAASHLGAARAEGVSVAVTPASGACSDAITVHVSGIEPNTYTYLFVASAGERSNPDRVLMISFFSDTTLTSWDYPAPPGFRFLCDELAAPRLDLFVSASVSAAGLPAEVLASTAFVRTARDSPSPGPAIALTPTDGPCARPPTVDGAGFPPNASIEVVVGPLVSLPGNGGAGFALPAGTADASGAFHSAALAQNGPDGSNARLFEIECQHSGRLLVSAAPGRDASGSRGDFPMALAEFRSDALEPPPAGSGVAPDMRSAWPVTVAALLFAASGALALVLLNRRSRPGSDSRARGRTL